MYEAASATGDAQKTAAADLALKELCAIVDGTMTEVEAIQKKHAECEGGEKP